MKARDVAGVRFGRLVALRRVENGPSGDTRWACLCDCDTTREVIVPVSGMVAGRAKSCGCIRRETSRASRLSHGKSDSRAYHSWSGAKGRCYNRLAAKWKDYGGRGITMCRRWRDNSAAFLADMGDPPEGRSLDRIDVNGHYSCGKCDDCAARGLAANCRWATPKEQARNTRFNVVVGAHGSSATIAEWSERTGIDPGAIRARVGRGVTGEDAVSAEDFSVHRVIIGPDGTALRLSEWARRTGISAATILWRIKAGWSEAFAASTPKTHKSRPAERKQ